MTDEHADPESFEEWMALHFGGDPEDWTVDFDTPELSPEGKRAAEKLRRGELDGRIEQIDDPDQHYSTEEVVDEIGITLDDSDAADDC